MTPTTPLRVSRRLLCLQHLRQPVRVRRPHAEAGESAKAVSAAGLAILFCRDARALLVPLPEQTARIDIAQSELTKFVTISRRSTTHRMNRTLVLVSALGAGLMTAAGMAQTPAAPAPTQLPSARRSNACSGRRRKPFPPKIALVAFEQAVFATNEGQRAVQDIQTEVQAEEGPDRRSLQRGRFAEEAVAERAGYACPTQSAPPS